MTIVAHVHPYVVGVDTRARHHVYSIVQAKTGELLESQKFPATEAGINRAMTWVLKRTESKMQILWVIEETASYGAILTGKVLADGFEVAEAPRVDSQHRYGSGKTDYMDSFQMARTAAGLPVDKLRRPRQGNGVRQAVKILVASRELMTRERTSYINALTALVRSNSLGVDARYALSRIQIEQISAWRQREETVELRIARVEAKRLACHIYGSMNSYVPMKASLSVLSRSVKQPRCCRRRALVPLASRSVSRLGLTTAGYALKQNSLH